MRRMLMGLVLMLAALPARAVDGVDLPGHDYARFPAPSAVTCRHSCGGEALCQAYTWVRPGVQGPEAICYLKNVEPAIVKNGCCDSAPRRFIDPQEPQIESGIDRPGSDFRHFATRGGASDWLECQAACRYDSACGSWTYVRRGIQGPDGQCWLKRGVARPVANANTVSGVKQVAPLHR